MIAATTKRPSWIAVGLLSALAIGVYVNTLNAPFLFDDFPSINDNPSIKRLWRIWEVLMPPPGGSINSRPVINLSLAINYALGGLEPRGYHITNLLIHLAASLALYGAARRTLLLSRAFGQRSVGVSPEAAEQTEVARASRSIRLGFSVATLWAVHPLLTESVTCVIQRTESLMGAFFLGVFYCFVRMQDAPRPARWRNAALVLCVLGMGTKEVMATVPLMVLLFDRAFFAGSFSAAWKNNRTLYVGMAATWIFVIAFVIQGGGNRNGVVAFDAPIWWRNLCTQSAAITRYVWLSVWPDRLVLDYGTSMVKGLGDVVPQAALVLAGLTGTVLALWRRPAIGFFGAWFFVILAPSSSIIPLLTQPIAEHRMYLPLVAVVAGFVAIVHRLFGRRLLYAVAPCIVVLATRTIYRNTDYKSSLAIWQATMKQCPENWRAHGNLGNALLERNRVEEAIVQFDEAMRLDVQAFFVARSLAEAHRLNKDYEQAIMYGKVAIASKPEDPTAWVTLGATYQDKEQYPDALECFARARELRPDNPAVRKGLAAALFSMKRYPEALKECEKALQLAPGDGEILNSLGQVLLAMERIPEAIASFEAAIKVKPDAPIYYNLGHALYRTDRRAEALRNYEEALALRPDLPGLIGDLNEALISMAVSDEALASYERALKYAPTSTELRWNYACSLAQRGRSEDAIVEYEQVLEHMPESAQVKCALADALNSVGRLDEAITLYRDVTSKERGDPAIYDALGCVLAKQGKTADALQNFQKALSLEPDFAPAHFHTAIALAVQKRFDDALTHYRSALNGMPDSVEVHLAYASTLLRLGRVLDARNLMETAARLDPENEDVRHMLIQVYSSQ